MTVHRCTDAPMHCEFSQKCGLILLCNHFLAIDDVEAFLEFLHSLSLQIEHLLGVVVLTCGVDDARWAFPVSVLIL